MFQRFNVPSNVELRPHKYNISCTLFYPFTFNGIHWHSLNLPAVTVRFGARKEKCPNERFFWSYLISTNNKQQHQIIWFVSDFPSFAQILSIQFFCYFGCIYVPHALRSFIWTFKHVYTEHIWSQFEYKHTTNT